MTSRLGTGKWLTFFYSVGQFITPPDILFNGPHISAIFFFYFKELCLCLFPSRSPIHDHTISLRFLGKILRDLRLDMGVSVYNVYITNQFLTPFAQGGGGAKSVCRRGCEWQGGKLIRLLSQLGPRIRTCSFSYPFTVLSPSASLFDTVRVFFFSFIDTQRGIRICFK